MHRLIEWALTKRANAVSRPIFHIYWQGMSQLLMLIIWCIAAVPAHAVLGKQEVGYVSYNGNPMRIAGIYGYTRADAEAMILERHRSPLSTIEATMWVKNDPFFGAGSDIFQLCVRGLSGPVRVSVCEAH